MVQGALSVTLAVAGYGPWAIIDGYLAGCVIWSLLLWAAVPYRPGLSFWRVRGAGLRPLLQFGAPAAGTALLLCLVFNVDYLIVGRLLGASALAYYTLGFRIPELVIISVFNVISVVAFPLFSRVREDEQRLHGGYLFGLRVQAIYGAAAGVGLAMAAPMIVNVVFGRAWGPAAAALPLALVMQVVASRVLGIPLRQIIRALRPAVAVALGVALAMAPVRFLMIGPEPVRLAFALAAGAAGAVLAVALADRRVALEFKRLIIPGSQVQLAMGAE